MTDERDICDRLEDARYDGAFAMRRDAARLIRQLRYYTTRLEADLVAADLETERLRKRIAKQQLDLATLGQEVGGLWRIIYDLLDDKDETDRAAALAALDKPRAAND
jgi:hypothetical protein